MTTRSSENWVLQPFAALQHWAEYSPKAPLMRDGVHELSYAQVNVNARKLSRQLRSLGVQTGDVIALELSVALQVIFLAAAAQLRLATCVFNDHAAGADHFKPNWLFSSTRRASHAADRVVSVDGAFLRAVEAHEPLDEIEPYDSTDELYRIAYSSGSTGLPKAVPLTLDMVHHRALAANELIQAGGPFMSILDMGTASGFHTFHGALLRGDCFYNPGDAEHNLRQIRSFGITAIKTSPVQLAQLCAATKAAAQRLDSLTHVFSAGSVVPVAARLALQQVSAARLFTLYGSTEAGRCAERELSDNDLSSVGPVVAGTELSIVDASGDEVAAGETGAIRYRRAHQATQYLGAPDATAETFVDGWFVTGDLGFVNADGALALAGRANDVANAGGIKVDLHSIELAALQSGTLSDAGAAICEDADGASVVALAVVGGSPADHAVLARQISERFGPLAPRAIVVVETVPRNAAGKLDRPALGRILNDAL